jgi:hypothetical protein
MPTLLNRHKYNIDMVQAYLMAIQYDGGNITILSMPLEEILRLTLSLAADPSARLGRVRVQSCRQLSMIVGPLERRSCQANFVRKHKFSEGNQTYWLIHQQRSGLMPCYCPNNRGTQT